MSRLAAQLANSGRRFFDGMQEGMDWSRYRLILKYWSSSKGCRLT